MHLDLSPLLATNVFLDPIVEFLHGVINGIHRVIPNYGWALVALGAVVKIFFWPLNAMQFKSMLKMQKLSPQVKALQARYKGDKEKLNAETMKLYRESGANPLMGCLPMLLQMPILISLYYAIQTDQKLFESSGWLWIGSGLLPWFAPNLAKPDFLLLGLYVASMYFLIRYTSPAMDEQQAQQQRIMAFLSPAMVGYFGFQYHWPAALVVYWFSYNVFTILQQLFLIQRYHYNPAPIGPHPEAVQPAAPASASAAPLSANGATGGKRKRRRSKR